MNEGHDTLIGRTEHGDRVYGWGAEGAAGQGSIAGQDHGRRAGKIAGNAIGDLLERVVYLEAIVSTRETTIADQDERLDKLNGFVESATQEHKLSSSVLRELGGVAERATVVMAAIYNRAQVKPIGKNSVAIIGIEALRPELAGALRRWRAAYTV